MQTVDELNATGIMFTRANMPFEAISLFNCALELDPFNPVLYLNRGVAYQKTGGYDEAINDFQIALSYKNEFAAAWAALALIYYERSWFSLAESCYRSALQLDTEEPEIWNNYGVLHFTQGDYQGARSCFETAASMSPYYKDALINLRDTYRELQEWQAIAEVERSLAMLS
jgi:Tfp pilus assembly protein PilF